MHDGSITIRLAAEVREIERLNHLVRQYGELLGIPARTLYTVTLALDELVSNVVLYGFETAEGQEIVVRLEVKGEELFATIEDGGRAFNPCAAPTPDLTAPLEKRQVGGLGIHLVRSIMDQIDYVRQGEKNILSLRKKIRPRA